MTSTKRESVTPDQAGALGCALIVAIWTSTALWLQLTRPAGTTHLELVFLGVLAPLLWATAVAYAFRARWSYPAGMLVFLGVLLGGLKAAVDGTLYFSLSAYNVLTVLIFLAAAAGIIFSWRAFRQTPSLPWRGAALAIGGVLLLAAGLAFVLSTNEETLSRLNAQWMMSRLTRELAEMKSLEEKVGYLVEEGDLPSAALGIVVDDELVWSKALGDGVDGNTVYNLGSIAKPVTASAILQLAERGLLDLDADINEYLLFDVRHPSYPEIPITARMLLAHKAGLAHNTPIYGAYQKSDELLDWEEVHRGRTIYGPIERIGNRADFESFLEEYLTPGGRFYNPDNWASQRPGTAYVYSTPGYDLLGFLVEQVSGQSYDEYLQDNIFAPLGMDHTGRLGAAAGLRQAPPFERVHSSLWKTNVELPLYENERIGGGGLYSNVEDLSQFMIAHMNDGRAGQVQLLEPATVGRMHAPETKISGDIGMVASGYGWSHFMDGSWNYWGTPFEMRGAQGHGGHDYGYRARFLFVEEGEGGYGMIILTNLADLFKEDMLWFFGIYLQLEDLLMKEAQAMWQAKHKP
jgi:CubicO group peptidase (beta-lactamase class C family)